MPEARLTEYEKFHLLSFMRILFFSLKLIGAMVGLAGLFLLAVILRAHWQTDKINPLLPTLEQMQKFANQGQGPVAVYYLNSSTQMRAVTPLGHNSFILEWADGRLFVIDLGMDEEEADAFAKLLDRLGRGGPLEIKGSLAKLMGENIRDVAGVGLTHLHIDHGQGVVSFCAARGNGAKLFQTDTQAEENNFNTKEAAVLVANSCLSKGEMRKRGEIYALQGFPGLFLIEAGGHTPGSTFFFTQINSEFYIFAGDVNNSKKDLLVKKDKPFLYSKILVPENNAQLRRLRSWLVDIDQHPNTHVIISHDIEDIKAMGMMVYH